MKSNQQAYIRQDPFYSDGMVQQPLYDAAQYNPYPGVGGPYSGYAPAAVSTALVAPNASPATSSFNLNQIKGIIDRMGGIDGVMGHITRAQKIFQSIQQLSPMLKVLLGAFGTKKATTKKLDRLTPVGKRRRRSSTKRNVTKTYKRKSR
ncbi:MAG: hypothetical protein JWM44_1432 [Bacilli bacterium]|nr:hypothetical protein [Bacilli bacterium]